MGGDLHGQGTWLLEQQVLAKVPWALLALAAGRCGTWSLCLSGCCWTWAGCGLVLALLPALRLTACILQVSMSVMGHLS